MKKGSEENMQHPGKMEADINNKMPTMAPDASVEGRTTSQNSTSSRQMSGGATPVQGMNQSREMEQDDLREQKNL